MALKKIMGGIAVAVGLGLAPMGAGAVTPLTSADDHDAGSSIVQVINFGETYLFEDAYLANSGPVEYAFAFALTPPPDSVEATAAQVTLTFAGSVAGTEMNWATANLTNASGSFAGDASGTILSDATFSPIVDPISGAVLGLSASIMTTFIDPNLTQYLNIGFQSITAPVQVSVQVISAVPLPAGLALLLSGLGALVLVGSRRRMSAAAA